MTIAKVITIKFFLITHPMMRLGLLRSTVSNLISPFINGVVMQLDLFRAQMSSLKYHSLNGEMFKSN